MFLSADNLREHLPLGCTKSKLNHQSINIKNKNNSKENKYVLFSEIKTFLHDILKEANNLNRHST
jgi:hypothetical protein